MAPRPRATCMTPVHCGCGQPCLPQFAGLGAWLVMLGCIPTCRAPSGAGFGSPLGACMTAVHCEYGPIGDISGDTACNERGSVSRRQPLRPHPRPPQVNNLRSHPSSTTLTRTLCTLMHMPAGTSPMRACVTGRFCASPCPKLPRARWSCCGGLRPPAGRSLRAGPARSLLGLAHALLRLVGMGLGGHWRAPRSAGSLKKYEGHASSYARTPQHLVRWLPHVRA